MTSTVSFNPVPQVWGDVDVVQYIEDEPEYLPGSDDEEEENDFDMSELDMRMEWKKTKVEMKELQRRILRRTSIIEELRRAYLCDIVAMKDVLHKLKKPDLDEILAVWNATLPSVNLKDTLTLHSPALAHLSVEPCRQCGGTIDITFHESNKVEEITNKYLNMKERFHDVRLTLAKFEETEERLRMQMGDAAHTAHTEKEVLYHAIASVKQEIKASEETVAALRVEIKGKNEECSALKKSNKSLHFSLQSQSSLAEQHQNMSFKAESMLVKIQAHEDRAIEFKKTIDEKDNLMQVYHASSIEHETKAKELNTQLTSTKMVSAMQQDDNLKLKAELTTAENEILFLQDTLTPLREELRQVKMDAAIELDDVEQVRDNLRLDVRNLESDKRSYFERETNLKKEIEQLKVQLAKKDSLIGELEGDLDDAARADAIHQEEIQSLQQFMQDSINAKAKGGRNKVKRQVKPSAMLQGESYSDEEEEEEEEEEVYSPAPRAKKYLPKTKRTMPIMPRKQAVAEEEVEVEEYSDEEAEEEERHEVLAPRAKRRVKKLKKARSGFSGEKVSFVSGDAEDEEEGTHEASAEEEKMNILVQGIKQRKRETSLVVAARESRRNPKALAASKSMSTDGNSTETDSDDDDDYVVQSPVKQKHYVKVRKNAVSASSSAAKFAEARDQGITIEYSEKAKSRTASIRTDQSAHLSRKYASQPTLKSPPPSTPYATPTTSAQVSSPNPTTVSSVAPKQTSTSYPKPKPATAAVGSSKAATAHSSAVVHERVNAEARQGSSPEELALREAILCTLTATVGPIPARKAINALLPVIALYGSLLTNAMEGMWESMIICRKGADFYNKVIYIFERIIECAKAETSADDVAEICVECVPLAKSSFGGVGVVPWQESYVLSDEVVNGLAGQVDFQSGAVSYVPYGNYFGTHEDSFLGKMDSANGAINAMKEYTNLSLPRLNDQLVNVLKEWSDAKATFIDIDSIVEAGKKAVRDAADREINSILSELAASFAKLEAAKEQLKVKQLNLDTNAVELGDLRPLPEKVMSQEERIRDLIKKMTKVSEERDEQVDTNTHLTGNIEKLNKNIAKVDEKLNEAIDAKEKMSVELKLVKSEEAELKHDLHTTKSSLNVLRHENDNRINALETVEVQTEPDVQSAGIQTEFICPPMSLRVAARLSSTSSKTQFPVVYSSFPQNISGGVDISTTAAMDDDDMFTQVSTTSRGSNVLFDSSSVASSIGMGSVSVSQSSRQKNPHKRNKEKDAYAFLQKTPVYPTVATNDLLSVDNSSATAIRSRLSSAPNHVKNFSGFSDDLDDHARSGTADNHVARVAVVNNRRGEQMVTLPAREDSIHAGREFLGSAHAGHPEDSRVDVTSSPRSSTSDISCRIKPPSITRAISPLVSNSRERFSNHELDDAKENSFVDMPDNLSEVSFRSNHYESSQGDYSPANGSGQPRSGSMVDSGIAVTPVKRRILAATLQSASGRLNIRNVDALAVHQVFHPNEDASVSSGRISGNSTARVKTADGKRPSGTQTLPTLSSYGASMSKPPLSAAGVPFAKANNAAASAIGSNLYLFNSRTSTAGTGNSRQSSSHSSRKPGIPPPLEDMLPRQSLS